MVNLKHNYFGYVYCWATACNDGEICKAYLNDCISAHNVYKMTGSKTSFGFNKWESYSY